MGFSQNWIVRYSGSALVLFVLPVAWYLLVYQRLEVRQAYYKTHQVELAKQVSLMPILKGRIGTLEKKKYDLHNQYQETCSKLDNLCHTRLLHLANKLQEHKIMLKTMNQDSLTFAGTLTDVYYFFSTLVNDVACTCSHVILTRENNQFECRCVLTSCCLNKVEKSPST